MSDLKVNPATVEFVKKEQARRRQRRAVASVVGLVLISGISTAGYFGWTKHKANQQAAIAKSIAAEIKPGTPGGWEKMRAAVDSGQLTREQARDAMETAREAQFQKTTETYFKTPVKDRDKYLDTLIDEQMKRMAEWQKDHPTTQPTTRPNGWGNGPSTRPGGGNGPGQGGPGGARGQQRADNTSPVQRAQRSEFMAAIRARMKERGIEMPRGGGRGFGGGGGGRGGRG